MCLFLQSHNDYFRSAAVTDNHLLASTFNPLILMLLLSPPSDFVLLSIDQSRVSFLLKNLDEKKSVGPDGLSAKFLKKVSDEIVNPLIKLLIINHYRLGCFLMSGNVVM